MGWTMAETDNPYAQQRYVARTDAALDEGLRAYMQRVYSYMNAIRSLTTVVDHQPISTRGTNRNSITGSTGIP